jgi:HPt (histidine-containing phosphotransfer) domain-containing protein
MDGYLTKPATIATLRAELLRWFPGALEPGRPNPALDPSALVAIVGDDPDVLRDLLEDYGRTARIQVAEMEQAGVAGRAAEVAATAHKLKSSSRAVGAMKLGDLCETLERDGRAGELEALRTSLGQLRAEFDAVQACLGERLEPRMARRAGA